MTLACCAKFCLRTSLGKETVPSPGKRRCMPSQGVNRCSAPVPSSSHLGDARHALCPCFRLPPSLATVSRANFYCAFRSIWQRATNNGLPDGGLSFKALKPIATHVPISETARCLQDLLTLRCLFVFALGLLACIVLYSSRGLGFNRMEIDGDADTSGNAMDVDSAPLAGSRRASESGATQGLAIPLPGPIVDGKRQKRFMRM